MTLAEYSIVSADRQEPAGDCAIRASTVISTVILDARALALAKSAMMLVVLALSVTGRVQPLQRRLQR
jgi:hypothetical protein